MTKAFFAGIAAIFLTAGCDNASKPAPEPVAETTPAPTLPDDLTFEDAVANFDATTQHLVWVLPPGIAAKGPFGAQVIVKADGATEMDTTIPLNAEKPAAGSRPEYPVGAEVLRLSTDASYPQRLEEIRGVMDGITSRLGPGHGELIITTDFKTEIGDSFRQEYCVDGKLPPIAIYLEQGAPSTLRKLPIAGGESILRATILAGCAVPRAAP
ncbi:MAG: hypothetical protein Q8R82_19225 [Hyphomonadaceae bacterium]|nr:hypothetical protein [Hyphomonadaceae bacterium]